VKVGVQFGSNLNLQRPAISNLKKTESKGILLLRKKMFGIKTVAS
jgi:hypothetical protein